MNCVRAYSARAAHRGDHGAVQLVYELAAAGNLEKAMEAMDLLTGEDAGLISGGADSQPGGPVCYHHIYSDSQLSISVFVLPPGACIPLHDHPGMTVLSKLLFGKLRVTSFDMPSDAQSSQSWPFRIGGDRRLICGPGLQREVSAPCAPLRLDAVQGNIHSFEALEHTAIFDVLTPPYDNASGRSCHYYEVVDAQEGSDAAQHIELLEVPWPDWLDVVNRKYTGQRVTPS